MKILLSLLMLLLLITPDLAFARRWSTVNFFNRTKTPVTVTLSYLYLPGRTAVLSPGGAFTESYEDFIDVAKLKIVGPEGATVNARGCEIQIVDSGIANIYDGVFFRHECQFDCMSSINCIVPGKLLNGISQTITLENPTDTEFDITPEFTAGIFSPGKFRVPPRSNATVFSVQIWHSLS